MEYTENTISATASPTSSLSPTSVPDSPPSSPPVILSPCAACKILRRRCVEKCLLAPYFPPTDPLKFTIAHRVFGASNIIKLLQDLGEGQRADAVNSMVYEANARLRDPVYGCAGAICQLQKQINQLQAQLAKAQAEIMNVQCQNTNLLDLLFCKQQISSSNNIQNDDDDHHEQVVMNMMMAPQSPILQYHDQNLAGFFLDESVLGEPLWT